MENEKINRGERLYDDFLEMLDNTFGTKMFRSVSNPPTSTLELFAVLEEREMRRELVAAMCRELAEEIGGENLYIEQGTLYQKITHYTKVK